MIRLTSILLILANATSGPVSAQGRVDKDRILYKISWSSWKIDNDSSLNCIVRCDSVLSPLAFEAIYFKGDSLCKVSKLTRKESGTELITYYYAGRKPILISVSRNNFVLENKTQIFQAINSFHAVADTMPPSAPSYIDEYNAEYYFDKENVRYASVAVYTLKGEIKNVRHDNKYDISEGMKLFNNAKRYLTAENAGISGSVQYTDKK